MHLFSDFLTVVRNSVLLKKKKVVFKSSKLIESACEILQEEGYIDNFKVIDDPIHGNKMKTIHIYLKYSKDGECPLHSIRVVSKPSRRIYVGHKDIKKVMDGFGISILSTSSGIVGSRKAKNQKIGGELLCNIW